MRRSPHRRSLTSRLRSERLRAALALGLLAPFTCAGTLAAWTDSVTVTGSTFSAGRIDLKVNGGDSNVAFTTINLAAMVPGNTTAGVLTVSNAGTAPLKYTASAATTNADGKGLGALLVAKVTGDATTTGSAPAKTCAGAALAGTGTALDANLVTTSRTLAAGASETLCVMVTLPSTAPSSVQGATTDATFTFSGTSF